MQAQGKGVLTIPAPKSEDGEPAVPEQPGLLTANCNKSPAPGSDGSRLQETWRLQCILSPSGRHTRLLLFADAQSRGSVIQQLILNITHPTPRGKAARTKPFLSLSVVLQSLGVFTLNSRPWKRIYSLITGIKGDVSQGVVRLLLRLFQASKSWLRLRPVGGYFILSPPLPEVPL